MFGITTYIVAVSGGVDSMVLLHKIAIKHTEGKNKDVRYVVAHFHHGIRTDADKDAELVKKKAEEYGFVCETGYGELGEKVNEAEARKARYEFLRALAQKHKAEKIITAHHQDDLLESMVINMLRGVGTRGLVPMTQPDILRPLLSKTKQELREYATANDLEWREDSTNDDERYLRNYVRKKLMPTLEPQRSELLAIHNRAVDLFHELDMRLEVVLPKRNVLYRPKFLALDWSLQKEFMRGWLLKMNVKELEREVIEHSALAVKTLPIGKKIDIGKHLWLKSERENVLLSSK